LLNLSRIGVLTLKEAFKEIKEFIRVNNVSHGEFRLVLKDYKHYKLEMTKKKLIVDK
jgi:hypothetical protein